MKLLSKYNRVNVWATIVVLLLSAICYYFFIRAVLIHQLDKDLKVEESEVIDFIKENNQLPEPTNLKDEQEEFLPVDNKNIQRNFKSVDIYNDAHKENFAYRQLEFVITVTGKNFIARIRKSQGETEDLIKLILEITLGVVLILLATLFIINRFLLSKLWKPFNTTLQQMKEFNLSGKDEVHLQESNITEFTELNNAVTIMINRTSQDYDEIKTFTENASHEIQTPLAIIKSKLELLSQSEILKEEQMNTIQSISAAAERLSKLNQSLILLTKIDNRQFQEIEKIDISFTISNQLNNYEELIAAKSIILKKNIAENVQLTMNEALAEILISNLLTNAIKHNIERGSIEITLTNANLIIENTGTALHSKPMELFERFKKDKVSSESLGLGLSILKKICEKYGYEIWYDCPQSVHITTINFKSEL